MNILVVLRTFLLVLTAAVHAADEREVHGRVVDRSGQPVANAAVSSFWSGNGKRLHKDGTPIDGPTKDKEEIQALWQHEGEMEPMSSVRNVQTDSQGRFSVNVGLGTHTLLAMDSSRQHGALATLTKGREDDPIEIRLGPLVQVRGTFECSETGKLPFWNHVYVLTPDDPTRPLDHTRLVSCGSFVGRFEVSLPPGNYDLDAYGTSTEKEDLDVRRIQPIKLDLCADKTDVDLGEILLPPYANPVQRLRKAKADGTSYDYTKHYGESPPAWHITEARGVHKDVQISDYKGEWVILTFWGLSCTVCLGDKLPRLMKFYEDHQAQHDQFEIIAICIDYDGELKTLADVDHALVPIVKNVWNGKKLPFPVLLDPTFKTWETFGLNGLGDTILIDPDGHMVAGDETTLAEKLK